MAMSRAASCSCKNGVLSWIALQFDRLVECAEQVDRLCARSAVAFSLLCVPFTFPNLILTGIFAHTISLPNTLPLVGLALSLILALRVTKSVRFVAFFYAAALYGVIVLRANASGGLVSPYLAGLWIPIFLAWYIAQSKWQVAFWAVAGAGLTAYYYIWPLPVPASELLKTINALNMTVQTLMYSLLFITVRNVLSNEMLSRLELERERAKAANRAKSLFLATMSHELRTPLHGILGISSLLESELSDAGSLPRVQGDLNSLNTIANQMLNLVNDLLDMSTLQAGKIKFPTVPVDVPGMVRGVVAAEQAAASAKGVHLHADVDARFDSAALVGPGKRLAQIMLNLVSNAVKFTQRGSVTVTATLSDLRPAIVGSGAASVDGGTAETAASSWDCCGRSGSGRRNRRGNSGRVTPFQGASRNSGAHHSSMGGGGGGGSSGAVSGDSPLQLPLLASGARVKWLVFEVADTGIGIPAADLERLFLPFTQIDGTITREFQGAGLGLSICKELATRMGGDVAVRSVFGKGSTFTCAVPLQLAYEDAGAPWASGFEESHSGHSAAMSRLDLPAQQGAAAAGAGAAALSVDSVENSPAPPLRTISDVSGSAAGAAAAAAGQGSAASSDQHARVTSAAAAAAAASAMSLLPAGSAPAQAQAAAALRPAEGPLFLVVDDIAVNRRVAARMLSHVFRGCTVAEAAHGLEAVAQFKATLAGRAHPFDAVFMDIHMPLMDGLEASRQIRLLEARANVKRPLPIVAVTADCRAEVGAECLAAGMDAHVTKPFQLEALLRVASQIGLPAVDDAVLAAAAAAAASSSSTAVAASGTGRALLPSQHGQQQQQHQQQQSSKGQTVITVVFSGGSSSSPGGSLPKMRLDLQLPGSADRRGSRDSNHGHNGFGSGGSLSSGSFTDDKSSPPIALRVAGSRGGGRVPSALSASTSASSAASPPPGVFPSPA